MADLTTLIGTIKYPDGIVPATANLSFTLTGYETDLTSDTVYAPRDRSVDLETDGTFSIDLWPNDAGDRRSQYLVELEITYSNAAGASVSKTFNLGYIEVPTSASDVDISNLLGQSTIPNDDVVSVEFMTSFLGFSIIDGGAPGTAFASGINFDGGTP